MENVMDAMNNRRFKSYLRADAFAAAHPKIFERTPMGAGAKATLHRATLELDRHTADQISGHGTVRKAAAVRKKARAALDESLKAIERAARVLSLEQTGVDLKFRLPERGSD